MSVLEVRADGKEFEILPVYVRKVVNRGGSTSGPGVSARPQFVPVKKLFMGSPHCYEK